MSLNKVMLIGNVGRDPEVRYLDGNGAGSQGRKVASFTLATSERYRDRNGELRENTEWHNIVVWGQSAEVVEKYVKKIGLDPHKYNKYQLYLLNDKYKGVW